MKARALLLNLAVAFIALLVLFPLLWMLSVSFMSTGEAATFPPPLLPKTWTLVHYRDLFVTQGGPAQSTVTVLYFMYEEGFKWWNLGSASAVAFILFLCIFAITLAQLWVSRRLGGET